MGAVCRSCGADVVWVETEASAKKPARNMPLDADDDGNPLRVDDGNLVLTGQASTRGAPIVRYVPKGKGNRRSHFASCPNADEHRKAKR